MAFEHRKGHTHTVFLYSVNYLKIMITNFYFYAYLLEWLVAASKFTIKTGKWWSNFHIVLHMMRHKHNRWHVALFLFLDPSMFLYFHSFVLNGRPVHDFCITIFEFFRQSLMVMDTSPIIDYYPTEFRTDLNGKQQEWEAVVLIPFIQEVCLHFNYCIMLRTATTLCNLID